MNTAKIISTVETLNEFRECLKLVIFGNLDLYSDDDESNEFFIYKGNKNSFISWKYLNSEDSENIPVYLEELLQLEEVKMYFDLAELCFDLKSFKIINTWNTIEAMLYGLRYFYKKDNVEFEVISDNGTSFSSKDVRDNFFEAIIDFIYEALETSKKVTIRYLDVVINILIE